MHCSSGVFFFFYLVMVGFKAVWKFFLASFCGFHKLFAMAIVLQFVLSVFFFYIVVTSFFS